MMNNTTNPLFDDTVKIACELALILRRYCIENNIDKQAIIAGVAWDGFAVKEKAYIDGKNEQKEIFRKKLGI